METNEVMNNEEIVDNFEENEEFDIDEGVNPAVVVGAFAAGAAALGFGKFVVYDKLLKPGAAKVKNKLANAKEEYKRRKNDEKSDEIIISNGQVVVDKDSEEQE